MCICAKWNKISQVTELLKIWMLSTLKLSHRFLLVKVASPTYILILIWIFFKKKTRSQLYQNGMAVLTGHSLSGLRCVGGQEVPESSAYGGALPHSSRRPKGYACTHIASCSGSPTLFLPLLVTGFLSEQTILCSADGTVCEFSAVSMSRPAARLKYQLL